jgi:hypothetical protein
MRLELWTSSLFSKQSGNRKFGKSLGKVDACILAPLRVCAFSPAAPAAPHEQGQRAATAWH